ncbi:MAG: FecR family protein [bacterium]|nr:FecR family protein [bacterium]
MRFNRRPYSPRALRRLLQILIGLALVATSGCGPTEDDYAVFQFVAGEVYIVKDGDDSQRVRAFPGATAGPQDVIQTRSDSAAELRVRELGIVRLGENSVLKLGDLDTQGRLNIKLEEGRAGFLMKRLKANQEFRVVTPTVIASVRGTRFLVGVDPAQDGDAQNLKPQQAKVAMLDGALELASPTGDDGTANPETTILDQPGEVRLQAGDTLSAASIQPLSAESIAEWKALEEMTSVGGSPRPGSEMIPPATGREIVPRANPLPLPK